MQRLRRMMRRLKPHRNTVLVVISSFLVPLITNIVSNAIGLAAGENLLVVIQILAGVVCLLLILAAFYRALNTREVPISAPPDSLPPYPGLILLVGRRPPGDDPFKSSAVPAIEHHLASTDQSRRLRVCWLIATQGDAGSTAVTNKLYDRFKDHCKVLISAITDPFSVQETYQVVRRIYNTEAAYYNLDPADVISDFTSGTHPMAAGMALACGDEWPMQYMIRSDGAAKPIFAQFNRQGGGR